MEPSTSRYFGVFELNLESLELRREGRPLRLAPQASTVLALLVERAGKLVSRDEIQAQVWQDGVVDFDQGVNNAIRQIRLALGDKASSPTFLETVPRRGYRFIAPVTTGADGTSANPAIKRQQASVPGQVVSHPRAWLGLALVVAIVLLLWQRQPSDLASEPWSLAVFPFTDLSSGSPQDFLAEGLAEVLVTELAALAPDRLRVIAHKVTRQSHRPDASPRALARELGLTHYLTGSIRRQGDQLRLAVRLLRVTDGELLWAESFDRRVEDLLAVEKEIGQRISAALALELPRPADASAKVQISESYLRGRYHLNQNTAESAQRSLPFFAQAILENPTFAPAHASLASAYLALPWEPRRLDLARRAVERALELDHRLALAHALRGEIALLADWQWQTSEEAFLLAIELDPAAIEPRAFYAYWLSLQGRHSEAIAQIHQTLTLDPVLSIVRADFALVYFLARRYEAAHDTYASLLELEPDSVRALDGIFFSLFYQGKFEQAKPWVGRLLRAQEADPEVIQSLAAAKPELAARQYLRWQLETLLRSTEDGASHPAHIAGLYAQLGEPELALDWLEQALAEKSTYLVHLDVAPELDSLRHHSRFEALRRKVGLGTSKQLSNAP